MNKKFLILLGFIFITSFSLSPLMNVRGSSDWEIDKEGKVTYIVDGDTFDVENIGRIRSADISTPEVGEPGYQEAKDYVNSSLYNKDVYLDVDDKYGTDIYGRIVAVAYLPHNFTHCLNFNKDLLVQELAVVTDYDNEFDPSEWSLYAEIPSDDDNVNGDNDNDNDGDDNDDDDNDDDNKSKKKENTTVTDVIILNIINLTILGTISAVGVLLYFILRDKKR